MLLGCRFQSRHERRFRTDLGDLAPRYGVKRSIEMSTPDRRDARTWRDRESRARRACARRLPCTTAPPRLGRGARCWRAHPVPEEPARSAASDARAPGPRGPAENAAFAPHHVTARALAASGEEPFAGGGVAGGRVIGGWRPQDLDIVDQRFELASVIVNPGIPGLGIQPRIRSRFAASNPRGGGECRRAWRLASPFPSDPWQPTQRAS